MKIERDAPGAPLEEFTQIMAKLRLSADFAIARMDSPRRRCFWCAQPLATWQINTCRECATHLSNYGGDDDSIPPAASKWAAKRDKPTLAKPTGHLVETAIFKVVLPLVVTATLIYCFVIIILTIIGTI